MSLLSSSLQSFYTDTVHHPHSAWLSNNLNFIPQTRKALHYATSSFEGLGFRHFSSWEINIWSSEHELCLLRWS